MQLNTFHSGNRLPLLLSHGNHISSKKVFLIASGEGRRMCVLRTRDAVGSLTFPFLNCILQPESISSPQRMGSVGVGNTVSGDNRLVSSPTGSELG